ncbi:RHS repeat domain-containing protein [Arundinibacter roseus]|uniref:Uncharacterized protein n=1 Tax=Arundinibacter roseus TaxID=2070510 RepID=A0A4R4JUW6_9BACT|nr:RHS repeat-associated core domain-containing protein [Arundinibacter roseus]TDB58547.1 hypothetical protein EZE20_23075 [Arundinibacter roseus]
MTLGNRRTFDERVKVIPKIEYYAFGHKVSRRAKNKYLYLTCELQQETGWLDLKARFYDPTLARFLSVDPLAEAQEFMSPYVLN